jgi:NodT family efflux transporter outer membrane factor (OMF) lipoprotein
VISGVAAAAIISGCAVGPDYHRPALHAPDRYAEAASTGAATPPIAAPDAAAWWRALNDSELDSLIERAVNANPDLAVALARLQQARTFEVGVVGQALPSAAGSAAAGRGTGTDLTRGRALPDLVSADSTKGLTSINELAGFDAVWELDVFGKYRREIQAARYGAQEALAARNAVLVTVISDVARAYIDMRGYQMQAAVLQAAVKALEESQRIADIRFRRGITNELDAALAARELATLQASVAPVAAQVKAAQYTIAVLLGQYPEDLVAELTPAALVPAVPSVTDTGLPLDLLRRRPDVQEAEWQLAGATARIGIATANLFPQLAVTGGIGYQRQALGVTPTVGQHVWSFGPAAIWPLLDFGALDAAVEIADLETRALLANYRKVLQDAVRQVDTAANALNAERQRLVNLGDAMIASQRAVTLANERYVRGLTDYLNVVDAERQAFEIEVEYTAAQVALGDQFVLLYKSLGGGWEHYQDLPPSYVPKPAVIAAFRRMLGHDDPLR